MLAIAIAAGFFFDRTVFVCLIGAALGYYADVLIIITKKTWVSLILLAISLGVCILSFAVGGVLLFCWLTLLLPKFERVCGIFENRVLTYLGDISFGIYSFHWPLCCSLGAAVIIAFWGAMSAGVSIFIALTISLVASIALSVAFYYTAERFGSWLVSIIRKHLYSLLHKEKNDTGKV